MSHTTQQQPLAHPGRQAAWRFRALTTGNPVPRMTHVLPHQVPQGWAAPGARVQRLEAVLGHAVGAAGPSRTVEAGAADRGAPLSSGTQKPEDNAPAYTRRSGTNSFRHTPQTVSPEALTGGLTPARPDFWLRHRDR